MLHPSPSEPCRAEHASPTTLRRAMPRPTTPVPCPDCHHPILRHLLPGSRPSVKAAGLKCCGNSSLSPSHRSPKARGGGVCGVSRFSRIFPGFCAWAVRFPRGWSKARGHASAPRSLLRGRSRAGGSRGRHARRSGGPPIADSRPAMCGPLDFCSGAHRDGEGRQVGRVRSTGRRAGLPTIDGVGVHVSPNQLRSGSAPIP